MDRPDARPDPGRAQHVLEAFRVLARTAAHGQDQALLSCDLTMAQMKALFTVAEHGPLPVSGLSHRLAVGLPAASHLVECLVKVNMVERLPNQADRRVVRCQVTERGRALVDTVVGRRQTVLIRWLDQLSSDALDALICGLDALVQVARSETPSLCGSEEE